MHPIQIPVSPISERTACAELPHRIRAVIDSYEEQEHDSYPPLLIFEPYEESRIPGFVARISEAPEELLVIAIEPSVREAVLQALECVAAREPLNPPQGPPKTIKLKPNTPLKSVFRQMAEAHLTVFSITVPSDSPYFTTYFFMRTPFTISEFRRELHQATE